MDERRRACARSRPPTSPCPTERARRALDADEPRAPRAHLLEVPLARHARPDPRRRTPRTSAAVVLLFRPLVLLRFRAPEYEIDARPRHRALADRATACSSRRAGAAATATSRSTSAAAARSEPGWRPSHVEVEVANFYPAIATWLTRFVYSHTQSRIHVLVTHGFLRSLARLELEESAVGRFAEDRAACAGRATARSPSARRRGAWIAALAAAGARGAWPRRALADAASSRQRSRSAPAACRGRGATWIRRTVPERVRMTSDSVDGAARALVADALRARRRR